jgi:hypothetical protein
MGLGSVGVDSSPVAVALTSAKLAKTRERDVMTVCKRILSASSTQREVPTGEFWNLAFDSAVLGQLCQLREELIRDCSSDARRVLRAILLGALHGPIGKQSNSYFSNQCPRTFSPKPAYAVRFWRERGLRPPKVDLAAVVQKRAARFLSGCPASAPARVVLGDSTNGDVFAGCRFNWAITSPPYYGMRTYIPDQWLRNWFVGGPSAVVYTPPACEIKHSSPEAFAAELRKVWKGIASHAAGTARLVVRFGGISDRQASSVEILRLSLKDSGWRLTTMRSAGDADCGRRQATQFVHGGPAPQEEHDFYARLA